MKKFLLLLILSLGGVINSFAQHTPSTRMVKIEDMTNFSHSYFVDLTVGNSMRVDVYDRYGPQLKFNIDSLMNIAMSGYNIIKDSLESDYYARTMDINLYDTMLRSIGWNSTPPNEKRILIYDSTASIVKFLQDTVFIKMYSILPAIGETVPAFLKLTLCLNNIRKLPTFVTGKYNALFDSLDANDRKLWSIGNNGLSYFKSNPAVQVLRAYDETKRQISFRAMASFSAQNYKGHFVPSVSLAIGRVNEMFYIREEIYLGYEWEFTFQPGADGRTATFTNEFVTFSYKTSNLNRRKNQIIGVFPNLKLGYLLKRKGTVFDKQTFKLAIAQFAFGKSSLMIEPTFYFHNFFKGISPSLRITQSF